MHAWTGLAATGYIQDDKGQELTNPTSTEEEAPAATDKELVGHYLWLQQRSTTSDSRKSEERKKKETPSKRTGERGP